MSNRLKSIVYAVAAGVIGAGLAACSFGNGDRVRVPFHYVIPVSGPATLTLDNTAGTVSVVAWNKPSIDISGIKTAGDRQAVDAMTIAVQHTGSTVNVMTQYARGMHQGGAIYVIHLPATTSLDLTNVAGTLSVEGMASNVKTHVSAGTTDVSMARLTGTQRVKLEGTTGTVTLRIPRNSDATIDAHQAIGSVQTEVPNKVGNGSAKVTLSATVGTISLDWTS